MSDLPGCTTSDYDPTKCEKSLRRHELVIFGESWCEASRKAYEYANAKLAPGSFAMVWISVMGNEAAYEMYQRYVKNERNPRKSYMLQDCEAKISSPVEPVLDKIPQAFWINHQSTRTQTWAAGAGIFNMVDCIVSRESKETKISTTSSTTSQAYGQNFGVNNQSDIATILAKHPTVLFRYIDSCTPSNRGQVALNNLGIPYYLVNLQRDLPQSVKNAFLPFISPQSEFSMPLFFYNRNFIGGADVLSTWRPSSSSSSSSSSARAPTYHHQPPPMNSPFAPIPRMDH